MITETHYKSYDRSYICRHKCNESPYTERFTKKCAIFKCENLQDKTESLNMLMQHLSEIRLTTEF